MAINFSDKVLVTNPTAYHLGRSIAGFGALLVAVGIVTSFTGDFLLPAMLWCALGVPVCVIGIFFLLGGVTRP
jgi:hypothetical protein